MAWWRKEPGQQQGHHWPEYSITYNRSTNTSINYLVIIVDIGFVPAQCLAIDYGMFLMFLN